MKSKQLSKKKIWWYSISIVVTAILLLLMWAVIRNWNIIHVLNKDKLSYNFQSMDNIFPSRAIEASQPVFRFDTLQKELPQTYTYKDQTLAIEDFLQRTKTNGLLVLKDDKIVKEFYQNGINEQTRFTSWSVAKSFISALVGIALDEGFIKNVNDPITQYVPELKGSGYDGVPIKDILRMASGVSFDEDYDATFSDINMMMYKTFLFDKSINDYALGLQSQRPSGTFQHYISIDTQVLGMLISKVTGNPPSQYLQEKIWGPLGMESNAYWSTDRLGTELSFMGLNATIRDYAKFGSLYLHEGNWNGKQIISKKWVQESTQIEKPQPNHDPKGVLGYQYQWWEADPADGSYSAIGVYGQFIYVNPKANVVIVKTSADPDYGRADYHDENFAVFQSIANHFSK
ncbi:serine hydrolase domain-containing protein [Brevibacillus laterosporus]|uniref:serine hydrolase domain-containing protein n=1 Tax=Brevibacillus laterosporus TaxID=1465 RepID=UPI000EAEAD9C|nr:serine hydrolase [Brevibacillus laterosporus]AYK06327.1 class C beta-lactamase-related serine hydrolase [Brevibacillus laterosporus]